MLLSLSNSNNIFSFSSIKHTNGFLILLTSIPFHTNNYALNIPVVFHQLSSDMGIAFQIHFCASRMIISSGLSVKAATHSKCGMALTNNPKETGYIIKHKK